MSDIQTHKTACANESSEDVLVMLAEQYPESKTIVDKRKRTPLHFALGHTERPASVGTVVLLSGTGAASMSDENGMLVSAYCCIFVGVFTCMHQISHPQYNVSNNNQATALCMCLWSY